MEGNYRLTWTSKVKKCNATYQMNPSILSEIILYKSKINAGTVCPRMENIERTNRIVLSQTKQF